VCWVNRPEEEDDDEEEEKDEEEDEEIVEEVEEKYGDKLERAHGGIFPPFTASSPYFDSLFTSWG
jgi:hypothetical protein